MRVTLILLAILLEVSCSRYQKTQDRSRASHSFSNITNTLEKMLSTYDVRLRPKFGIEPLTVLMEVHIGSFDSISEVNMDYTITMDLNQYWNDERLMFGNRNDYLILVGDFIDRIWVPDTFIANDKYAYLHEVTEQNKMLKLYGNGDIVYGMRFTTTLACMMDLRNYPLDSQNCTVEIESYGYIKSEVNIKWKRYKESVLNVEKISLPQFHIADYVTSTYIETEATGQYVRLSLSFLLQRQIGFFIFQTYLPSILIVMLSWISFWINHEATSARVALGITTVLTMTTISTGVRASLPRISYVKAIDIYLLTCFLFVFSALLEFAAVNYTFWSDRALKRKLFTQLNQQHQQKRVKDSIWHDDKDGEELANMAASSNGRLSPLPWFYRNDLAPTSASNKLGRDKPLKFGDSLQFNKPFDNLRARKNIGASSLLTLDNERLFYGGGILSQVEANGWLGRHKQHQPQFQQQYQRTSVTNYNSKLKAARFKKKFGSVVNNNAASYMDNNSNSMGITNMLSGSYPNNSSEYYTYNEAATSISKKENKRMRNGSRRNSLCKFLATNSNKFSDMIPHVSDVKKIDRYSRVCYPLFFLLFNIAYWFFYISFSPEITNNFHD